jgi:hypothetical protein
MSINTARAFLNLLYWSILCLQHPVVVFQYQFLLDMDNETHSSLQIVETGEILLSEKQIIHTILIYVMFIYSLFT